MTVARPCTRLVRELELLADAWMSLSRTSLDIGNPRSDGIAHAYAYAAKELRMLIAKIPGDGKGGGNG